MISRPTRNRLILILILIMTLMALAAKPSNVLAASAQQAPASKMGAVFSGVSAVTTFGKVSPANGATSQATSVTLKWNAAPSNPYGFDQYYKYCYYATGGTCNYAGVLTTTQYSISGLTQGVTYFWQIQLVNCKDSTCTQKERIDADGGQVWSFTTLGGNPPGAFSKSMPADNDLSIASRMLSWQSSTGATSYQVCYTPTINDTNCAYLGAWKDVGNVTTYTMPNDAKFIWGNRYYWQVKAVNSGGNTLANSGTWWSFTTANLIGKVTLISPDGIINESTPTYRWNELSGATWYYLWITGSTGNTVFNQWYQASAFCNAGTCAATPSITLGGGDFTWKIQAWNSTGYGPWSNALAFNTPIPTPPGTPTLVSPSGDIGTNYTPTFIWNAAPMKAMSNGDSTKIEPREDSTATRYQLWIGDPSGKVYSAWYDAVSICSAGSCSVTSPLTLKGGTYTWWVQAWNSAGYGQWSTGKVFSIVPLGAATLVTPTGYIDTNYNPTYTWNQVGGSTWYYLWVNGPNGNVIKQWYTSAQANCNGTTCSVTPATTLRSGAHTWWIQTWNEAGIGPWSAPMAFSTFTPPLPGASTLLTPSGDIGTNYNPTYTWNQVTGATYYYLWVNGPSGVVIQQWYTSAQANCNGTTCSATPATTLDVGTHSWWIRTWNAGGYGPWSSAMTFSVTIPTVPGAATLVSPTGSIGTNNPDYTWNKVSDATWYYLWINDASSNVFKQWYKAADVCGASTCTVTAPVSLATGPHFWWIQTWNSVGLGPWSTKLDFSIP